MPRATLKAAAVLLNLTVPQNNVKATLLCGPY